MPMVSEFVEAGVGTDDECIAHFFGNGSDATVQNPVFCPRLRTGRITHLGHTKQVNPADASFGALGCVATQRINVELELARH